MDALFKRLAFYTHLRDSDQQKLHELGMRRQSFDPGEDIVTRGSKTDTVFVISKGWAARYVTLEDGRSQVLNFMLPGDLFDLQVFLDSECDHSVCAVTAVTTVQVSAPSILALFSNGSPIAAALWWATVQEEGILREQIVRNGRRSARERVAHLILELHRRAQIVGETAGDTMSLPVSQLLIADCLGLSFVHVNRVLRGLERDGHIERSRNIVTIADRAALVEISGYTEEHLHLEGPPRRLSFMAVAE